MPENAGTIQEIRNPDGTFKPGVSGNPEGKKPGTKHFTTKVREALMELSETGKSEEREIVEAVIKKAKAGDTQMMKLMWNYLDGMPQQHVDHTSDGDKIVFLPNEVINKLNKQDHAGGTN